MCAICAAFEMSAKESCSMMTARSHSDITPTCGRATRTATVTKTTTQCMDWKCKRVCWGVCYRYYDYVSMCCPRVCFQQTRTTSTTTTTTTTSAQQCFCVYSIFSESCRHTNRIGDVSPPSQRHHQNHMCGSTVESVIQAGIF